MWKLCYRYSPSFQVTRWTLITMIFRRNNFSHSFLLRQFSSKAFNTLFFNWSLYFNCNQASCLNTVEVLLCLLNHNSFHIVCLLILMYLLKLDIFNLLYRRIPSNCVQVNIYLLWHPHSLGRIYVFMPILQYITNLCSYVSVCCQIKLTWTKKVNFFF